MTVLVIPEDFRNDQYLLKPLFKQLFKTLGKPRARVEVCQDPLLGGVGEALKLKRIQEVLDLHDSMVDIIILCVDRDGVQGRRRRLDQIEHEFGQGRTFLAECAWEEIETWALAGLDLPADWNWAEVRGEIQVKETYFDVLAKKRGVADGLGGGREVLGEEAAHRIPSIRQKCREDFDALAKRLKAVI
ncbi:MAG: hypothetical protein OXB91_06565 [Bryobacterales bacterium]|nr:hypothetical protein [Bryobacterales bacterium]